MPSSLTVIHSSALVFSTRPRVSVYGTGSFTISGSGFSRQSDYVHYRVTPRGSAYCQVRFKWWICLPLSMPTPFNVLFRQYAALSLLRLHITHIGSTGLLTRSSIGLAARLNLRARLTLIRLALIRNPESFGVGVSRPHYRYLFLHLLFRTLQHGLSHTFAADRNAPLP